MNNTKTNKTNLFLSILVKAPNKLLLLLKNKEIQPAKEGNKIENFCNLPPHL